MSWTTTTRTAAEELGPPDCKNSSTGNEPHDHLITEAYVEFTQESVTEQRFLEDFDYDERSSVRAEDEPITLKEKACRPVCRRQ